MIMGGGVSSLQKGDRPIRAAHEEGLASSLGHFWCDRDNGRYVVDVREAARLLAISKNGHRHVVQHLLGGGVRREHHTLIR